LALFCDAGGLSHVFFLNQKKDMAQGQMVGADEPVQKYKNEISFYLDMIQTLCAESFLFMSFVHFFHRFKKFSKKND
jgi:hypothetical protein